MFFHTLKRESLNFCEANQPELPFVGLSIRSQIDSEGMLILLVNTESPCYNAGLKAGDVLLKIDDQQVNNIKDYRRIMTEVAHTKNLDLV